MSDRIIVGLTGRYIWYIRDVWFWEVPALVKEGWRKSKSFMGIRREMIYREQISDSPAGPWE